MTGPDGLPPPLFAQPMLHWLANLIASHAFADLDTIEQVLSLEPPKNGNFRILPWAADVREKPVFPEWSSSGPKTKPKNPQSWVSQFSDWGNRAGFTAQLGLHAVRREALIKVNDNGYSLGQVLRFASQNNTNVLVNKYLGSVSTVDGAGSYLGMQLRADLAEDFRSASAGRNPGLHFSLPAKETKELQKSLEYISLTNKINEINLELETSTSLEDQQQLELQRKVAYRERLLFENKKLKEFQTTQKVLYDIGQDDHEQCDWRQNHFNRISHVLPEERVRLAYSLQMKAWPRSPEWINALRDLVSLRSNHHPVAYQKELRPVQGCCPVATCRKNMLKVPKKDRWRHIYRCQEKAYVEEVGFARFCFLCSTWLKGEASWVAHCKDHVEKVSFPVRCNPVTHRHAVACAGYCPVHLGRTDLPVEERMRQWSDQDAWKRHISRCLATYLVQQQGQTISCPHPKCPVEVQFEKDFWYHQGDIHSIFEKTAVIGKRKTCSNEDERPPERPRKSKRVGIEQSVGLKVIPFVPDTKLLDSRHLYDSDYAQTQDSRSPTDPPDSLSNSPLLEYAQSETQEMYAFPTLLGSSPYCTDNENQVAGLVLSSASNLGHMKETLSTEQSPSRMTGIMVPIDPLLVSEGEPSATFDLDSLTAPDSDAKGVVTKDLSHRGAVVHCQQDPLQEQTYSVDCLLGRWGKDLFYLKWLDGSYGWEPRENILDEELVQDFEESYRGFKDGVEVLRTRIRNGKAEYRLHWDGRPKWEDWWVTEKELHPKLIEEHKPKKKSYVRRRRRNRCAYMC
ncbi:uncharacterized protein FMAN_06804 [Fusarium mangiferae]|uniref:Chromo domain-containing protein n=1 Tax=Fusarium mangiferae TaxID=192010 RepID=A0A1L7UJZ4_FUSMA|nr:uncharacterized protein FMAN_06804 [Fusarium mangiferae]CVL08763.1 uncharacterized protein FMAN_06804 [Fusarium mangiferae]